MAAQFYIACTEEDYRKMADYDKKCGLLTKSRDTSEIIKVAYVKDDKHYEYFITTKKRLVNSGINYKGKEAEEAKVVAPKVEKPKRRYQMVYYDDGLYR